MATWILTGSVENFRINVERGFDVIGFKERRRIQASQFEPGDEIVFYVTGLQAFGGIARVRSQMFEDEPVVVLEEESFVPAESLIDRLEHLRKWPAEHWHLGFQGQLRTVSEADAELLRERIEAAARTPAASG